MEMKTALIFLPLNNYWCLPDYLSYTFNWWSLSPDIFTVISSSVLYLSFTAKPPPKQTKKLFLKHLDQVGNVIYTWIYYEYLELFILIFIKNNTTFSNALAPNYLLNYMSTKYEITLYISALVKRAKHNLCECPI